MDKRVWSDYNYRDCNVGCFTRTSYGNLITSFHNPSNHYRQHMDDVSKWCIALSQGRLQFRTTFSSDPYNIIVRIPDISGGKSITITVYTDIL